MYIFDEKEQKIAKALLETLILKQNAKQTFVDELRLRVTTNNPLRINNTQLMTGQQTQSLHLFLTR
ncbi:MAG: hypothetical protein CMK83_25560 [Pseudomonadales bacterium]|nr:hypothetical protein [Pseudomonadales bacterium]